MLKLNWRAAFTYMFGCKDWTSKFGWGGLWIALCPPIGWILALGFRKEVVYRLIDNRLPYLPEWQQWRTFLLDGLKAVGVIYLYFLPYMLLFWLLAVESPAIAAEHPLAIVLFFLLVPVCLPLCMPFVPAIYLFLMPWMSLSLGAATALAALLALTTFVMPAAFGQWSLHRTFGSAFNLKAIARMLRLDLRAYAEAWAIAIVANVVAFSTLLLAPWGIFWSYHVITFAFNNALALSKDAKTSACFASSKMLAGDIMAARKGESSENV